MRSGRDRFGRIFAASGIVLGTALLAGSASVFAQQPRQDPPYKIVFDPTSVTTYAGDKPVMRYRYGEVPFKPYVDVFYTPSGVNVLRDAPADHLHHHGLMLAWRVDGVNFWEEEQNAGMQIHEAFAEVRTGKGGDIRYAGFMDEIAWVNPQARTPLLFEGRRIEVVQMPGQKASLLTWDSIFSLPPEKQTVRLEGADYHGVGMRFVESMDDGGRFFNSEGKTGVQGAHGAKARWLAYAATANGKPVTVALFDFPANLRHPATWFCMEDPFAYMSVTLDLDQQPLTLREEQPLVLRYGVALWDGQVDANEVDGLYRQWVNLFQAPQEPGAGAPQQPGQPRPAPGAQPQPGGPGRPGTPPPPRQR